MKKKGIFWSMLAVMLVSMLVVGFTACGSDDDDTPAGGGGGTGSGITGTWMGRDGNKTLTLVFASGNSGTWIFKYQDSYSGSETESGSFTYTMTGTNKGIATYERRDSYYSGGRTVIYYFVIDGNTLSLYEDDYYDDLEFVLTRQ